MQYCEVGETVDWRDKTREYLRTRGTTLPKLAERANLAYTTLKRAVDTPNTWTAVPKAIALAKVMGITVEELFNPDIPLPPEDHRDRGFESWDERQAALDLLAKMGEVEVLEGIARGIPRGSATTGEKKVERTRRPRKR